MATPSWYQVLSDHGMANLRQCPVAEVQMLNAFARGPRSCGRHQSTLRDGAGADGEAAFDSESL